METLLINGTEVQVFEGSGNATVERLVAQELAFSGKVRTTRKIEQTDVRRWPIETTVMTPTEADALEAMITDPDPFSVTGRLIWRKPGRERGRLITDRFDFSAGSEWAQTNQFALSQVASIFPGHTATQHVNLALAGSRSRFANFGALSAYPESLTWIWENGQHDYDFSATGDWGNDEDFTLVEVPGIYQGESGWQHTGDGAGAFRTLDGAGTLSTGREVFAVVVRNVDAAAARWMIWDQTAGDFVVRAEFDYTTGETSLVDAPVGSDPQHTAREIEPGVWLLICSGIPNNPGNVRQFFITPAVSQVDTAIIYRASWNHAQAKVRVGIRDSTVNDWLVEHDWNPGDFGGMNGDLTPEIAAGAVGTNHSASAVEIKPGVWALTVTGTPSNPGNSRQLRIYPTGLGVNTRAAVVHRAEAYPPVLCRLTAEPERQVVLHGLEQLRFEMAEVSG